MITSSKIFEFVEKLQAVVGDKLCNMYSIDLKPECNTPGCHAGWVEIALGIRNSGRNYHFLESAERLAIFLGFDSHRQLKYWAEDNPKIWGNEQGADMFGSPLAFSQLKDSFPAQILVDHWRGVGERLKKHEEVQSELS